MLAVIEGTVTAANVYICVRPKHPKSPHWQATVASFWQSCPKFLFIPKTDSPCEHRSKDPSHECPHPGPVSICEQSPGLRSLRRQVMHWIWDDAFVATAGGQLGSKVT